MMGKHEAQPESEKPPETATEAWKIIDTHYHLAGFLSFVFDAQSFDLLLWFPGASDLEKIRNNEAQASGLLANFKLMLFSWCRGRPAPYASNRLSGRTYSIALRASQMRNSLGSQLDSLADLTHYVKVKVDIVVGGRGSRR